MIAERIKAKQRAEHAVLHRADNRVTGSAETLEGLLSSREDLRDTQQLDFRGLQLF